MGDAGAWFTQLEQGEMYSLADWSVCLINKDTLCFISVEQHFEVGHLTFKIDQEQLSQGVRPLPDCTGTRACWS
jgi:hypothetical protein